MLLHKFQYFLVCSINLRPADTPGSTERKIKTPSVRAMARFVDLDDDDEAAPMPGQLAPKLSPQDQHLLLLRKLRQLPVDSDGRSLGRWPEGFYDRQENKMDGTTFRSSATDALQCYPYVQPPSPSILPMIALANLIFPASSLR